MQLKWNVSGGKSRWKGSELSFFSGDLRKDFDFPELGGKAGSDYFSTLLKKYLTLFSYQKHFS